VARVVPSQVVQFIDQVFPWASTQITNTVVNLTRQRANGLAGLLELVEQVPEELLTMNGSEYSSLVCSMAAIRERLELWRAQQAVENELTNLEGLPQLSPVRLIRDAISHCPDETPAPATSELGFVTPLDLRENLRNDIGIINRALSNGEWKAATVLAGSTIEALLLWSLQQRTPVDVTNAITGLRIAGTLTRQPDANMEKWDLHEYTEVAARLAIIQPTTTTEIRLAREFRNLIHPGRAQRLGQKCDRGTALSSVAALDHVVRDLTPP
jgi:hypothetical protein